MDHLKTLCENEYKIKDTQCYVSEIKDQTPLDNNEKDVSYYVDFLFTNIPVKQNHWLYYSPNIHSEKDSADIP